MTKRHEYRDPQDIVRAQDQADRLSSQRHFENVSGTILLLILVLVGVGIVLLPIWGARKIYVRHKGTGLAFAGVPLIAGSILAIVGIARAMTDATGRCGKSLLYCEPYWRANFQQQRALTSALIVVGVILMIGGLVLGFGLSGDEPDRTKDRYARRGTVVIVAVVFLAVGSIALLRDRSTVAQVLEKGLSAKLTQEIPEFADHGSVECPNEDYSRRAWPCSVLLDGREVIGTINMVLGDNGSFVEEGTV